MEAHLLLELIGYLASALIAIAMMMSSVLWLRVINSAGSATFAVYGLLIHAYPVAVLNAFIVIVNGYYLVEMLRAKRFFQLLKLKPESDYLKYFLDFHREEIAAILPGFAYRPAAGQLTLFILRDCAPVGVFIAAQQPNGTLRVILDFVIPGYRDLKLGRFLFTQQQAFFREQGIKEILIEPRTKKFGSYLVKVGFERALDLPGGFYIRYNDKLPA